MAWENSVVTNAGISMLRLVLAGGQLTITGARGGTGTVSAAALMAQTQLVNQKQTFSVVTSENTSSGKRLEIRITNTGLVTGYILNQVGIYAAVDNGTPALLAILQDEAGIEIPSISEVAEFLLEFFANVNFDNTANFNVNVDSNTYATLGDINEVKQSIETLDAAKLGTGGNGSNVTVAFTQAASKLNIVSGEKLSVILGKIMKWFSSFGAAAWMNTGTAAGTVAAGDHTHTAAAVGAVPVTRTVNGKALSGDITLSAGDVGAGTQEAVNAAQTTANNALANTQTLDAAKLGTGGDGSNVTAAFTPAASKVNIVSGDKLSVILGKIMKWFSSFGAAAWMNTGTAAGTVAAGDHTHTAAAVGAVPTTRKVNGKALSGDITLSAGDVGAGTQEAVNAAQTTANNALANTQTLDTAKLGTSGDGSNVTATFTSAASKVNIVSGEKLSVILGKIMKWFSSFGAAAWMNTGTAAGTVAAGDHTHTAAAVGAVPTTRMVNGKALSGDITLSAGDVGAGTQEAVNAAQTTANNAQTTADSKANAVHAHAISDVVDLSVDLSNKAGIIGALPSSTDLDDITQVGFYHATDAVAPSIQHRPFQYAFHLYVFRADASPNSVERTLQIATMSSITDDASSLLYRKHNNYGWSNWTRLSTATPPTWYNLTPASGWTVGTAYLRYCKDGGGTVFLTGAVQKNSAPTSAETLMILPEGFRPATYISFTAAQFSGATGAPWCAVCCVEPSGVVRFFAGTLPPNFATAKDLVINVAFPAAIA